MRAVGGTGMLIGAAVSASAELLGGLALAGGAGVAATEIADAASGEAKSPEGVGSVTAETDADAGGLAAETDAVAADAGSAARQVADEEPPPAASPSRLSDTCDSFVAGTTVLMADGTSEPILDVEVGDQITNKDSATGQVRTHTVMATHITADDTDFVDLTVQTPSGLSIITVTGHHLFWDGTTRQWATVDSLSQGDQLESWRNQYLSWRRKALCWSLTNVQSHGRCGPILTMLFRASVLFWYMIVLMVESMVGYSRLVQAMRSTICHRCFYAYLSVQWSCSSNVT